MKTVLVWRYIKIPVFQTKESGLYLGIQKDRCKRYLSKKVL